MLQAIAKWLSAVPLAPPTTANRRATVSAMFHQPALGRGPKARQSVRGLIRQGAILTCLVGLLSGCMAELQTGQRPTAPPAALVTPPAVPTTPTLPSVTPPPTAAVQPSAPGSLAPDPSTATPDTPATPTTAPPTEPAIPTTPPQPALPPLTLPTTPALTNEERWRAQQQDRVVFDGLVPFTTNGSELWWYDPVNQQHVILGVITGDFAAQAQFGLLGQGFGALEVPYQVNTSYGLTALSPAVLSRIAAAGYESDWIETYVFLSPDVTRR